MVPGSTVQLNIETSSQSLCSVSAIDKSAKFLAPSHQISKLDTLMGSFSPEDRGYLNSTRKTCIVRDRKHKSKLF